MEIHEGTSTVKEAKLYVLKGKFIEFVMKKDESVPEMFNRLNDIVNELKGLGFKVPDVDFYHKFLRSLPERYDTIVTLILRSDLKTSTPTQVLGEVLTHDIFKKSQDEVHGVTSDEKKKSVALKAQSSNEERKNDGNDDESDEKFAIFVRRFKRFMNKKSYGKKGQSSKKNPFEDRKCFECGELGHIVINYPNKKKNKKDKNDNDNNKKKFLKKKKNCQAYYVEWDSDASSDEDEDDDKPSKGVAGIAIKGAPSLFTTPHCLMAKGGAKVQ